MTLKAPADSPTMDSGGRLRPPRILGAGLALLGIACGGDAFEPIPLPDPVGVTLIVQTVGFGTDADGFDLRINGEVVARLGTAGAGTDSVTVQVTPGEHDVTVTDLDPGCRIAVLEEEQFFSDAPNRVEIEIFCLATGNIEVAYTASGNTGSEVVILDTDGAEALRPGGSSEWHPSWNPDGSRLVIVSDRDGNPELYLADPESGEDLRLTEHDGVDDEPAWSPDGTRVAFMSTRGGIGRDVWVLRIEDRSVTRLTETEAPESDPTWSPDGEWVAFGRVEMEVETLLSGEVDTTFVERIYRVPAEGGEEEFMMLGLDPEWGSDGRMYFSQSLGSVFGEGRAIGSRRLDGTDTRPHSGLGGSVRSDPELSPDGRYLLFAQGTGTRKIFARDLETGELRQISQGSSDHTTPAWRPGTTLGAGGG